jgi:HEAT repeat protein
VRLAAVTRLGTLRDKSKRAVKILTVALADRSSDVRARAASALGGLGGEQARQALVTAVRDQDTRVGIAAAGQLLALGDTRHLDDLKRAARQPNAELRAAAIRALGKWRDPKAKPLLVGALKDRAQQVRFSAAVALAQRADKRALPELERVAGQPGPQRIEATKALARLGSPPREALAATAASEQVEERREAMGLADLFAPGVALPFLRRGSTDHDATVRRGAASGLSRLLDSAQSSPAQRQQARRALRRLRSDADPSVRAVASLGLALARPRVGTLDEPTVQPVDPAPLPDKVKQPLKPPPKKSNKPLFVDDNFKQRIYKLQISKASLALRSGKHQRALRHLARARRAQDTPPVLYEYGFVHLSWATKLRGSASRAHLLKARGYYGQYLRRAPRGPLAKKARAGLRDVKRLLKRIAR